MSVIDSIKNLPPWAWFLAIGGGLGAAIYIRHQQQQRAADEAAASTMDGAATPDQVPAFSGLDPAAAGYFDGYGYPADLGLASAPINYSGNLFGANDPLQPSAAVVADQPAPAAVAPVIVNVPGAPAVVTGGGPPTRPAPAAKAPAKPATGRKPVYMPAPAPQNAKTWEEQVRWLAGHPDYLKKNGAWAKTHPETVAAAKALPGNRLPN